MRNRVRGATARLFPTLVIVAGLGFASPALAQSVVKISGSTTIYDVVMQPHKARIEAAAGVTLDVTANSSPRGLADLAAGRSDIAMLTAPLATVLGKMNEQDRGSIDASALKELKIGDAPVVFIVHPSNPVKALSFAQIRDIFAGKTTNWKQVGGTDAPIVVVCEVPGTGQRSLVEEKVMGGLPITSRVRTVVNAPQMVAITKQLPTAIAHATLKNTAEVSVIQTDRPLMVPMYLVTKGNPNGTLAKVIEAAAKTAR